MSSVISRDSLSLPYMTSTQPRANATCSSVYGAPITTTSSIFRAPFQTITSQCNNTKIMEQQQLHETEPIINPVSKRNEYLIVFDYDDTLLPSSYIQSFGQHLDICNLQYKLCMLENMIIKLLTSAIQCVGINNIVVITNAEKGWIQLSSQKFIPRAAKLLCRCKLISARSTYEKACSNNPTQWKLLAMYHQVQLFFSIKFPIHDAILRLARKSSCSDASERNVPVGSDREKSEIDELNHSMASLSISNQTISDNDNETDSETSISTSIHEDNAKENIKKQQLENIKKYETNYHIISFGDSSIERLAVTELGAVMKKSYPFTFIKSVKFTERPDITKVIKQLALVDCKLVAILNYQGDMDFRTGC